MSGPCRLPQGGAWIDRATRLRFSFDGRSYEGFAGDTLASALLAAGVRIVARSFKYHRPRGITGIGSEEPSALLRIGDAERLEPNARATTVELHDGLVARSQNCWPSLRLDAGSVVNLASGLLGAGFYYKTFMRPARAWLFYERAIRRMAGLGPAPDHPDPDSYDKQHAFADVLVVGGGPAGLAAALTAGRAGAQVVLVDESQSFAASLAGAPDSVDGMPAERWAAAAVAELEAMPRATLLPRATAFGVYDHGFVAVHQLLPGQPGPRSRIWKLRARRVVLAAGACERPLVFAGNDRPGVMGAAAVRYYLRRFGVLCGRDAVLFTNNDSAYATALELSAAGARVTVVDSRTAPAIARTDAARSVRVLEAALVRRVIGRRWVRTVEVAPAHGGAARRIACDVLAVSGGWTPNVHLFSQDRGHLRWDETIASFVPDARPGSLVAAGACRGIFGLRDCIAEGLVAGTQAARSAGYDCTDPTVPNARGEPSGYLQPLWVVPGPGKRFVDLQNDVTAADVRLAAREGYTGVELLKRYTTLGMGTDQGKTSNLNGLALLAQATERPIPKVGTTTFRPPYTPVTVGALAAFGSGEAGHPIRRTALQRWHERNGAVFVDAGEWRRPSYYPRPGEDGWAAVKREMRAVRSGVGLVDVGTLGKIDVQGRDAAALLERLYVNSWNKLPVGRGRYGLMLREDGMVFDDGVVMRLADDRFPVTTSTANADAVLRHMEFLLQTEWPDLRVFLTPVTDHWFAAALNGPLSRAVLAPLCDFDISNAALPLIAMQAGRVAGIAARVMRISFSGELAFEVNVPADSGEALWTALLEAGRPHGLHVYGTEAMSGLRIEKGHPVAGAEIDGRTTPDDLGLGKLVRRSGDFIGRRSLVLSPPPAWAGRQLVGLLGEADGDEFPPGGHVVAANLGGRPQPALGHVTSWGWSPTLDRMIGLALIEDGRAHLGKAMFVDAPVVGRTLPVAITHPVFYDPDGVRLRG